MARVCPSPKCHIVILTASKTTIKAIFGATLSRLVGQCRDSLSSFRSDQNSSCARCVEIHLSLRQSVRGTYFHGHCRQTQHTIQFTLSKLRGRGNPQALPLRLRTLDRPFFEDTNRSSSCRMGGLLFFVNALRI